MSIAKRLRWGMVGGGVGGFIGEAHRMAGRLDDDYELVAGALSSDPERARISAERCRIAPDRSYADYRDMARKEAGRPDGIEVVSIVTPNASHHAIASAFLESGIHVICDKPLATSLADARDLVDKADKAGRLLGVTHNYTGYPMIRHARDLVAGGVIGKVWHVQGEFVLGWMSVSLESEGVKQAWRVDPALAGPSGVVADIGTHVFHLAGFVTGLEAETLSADLATMVPGRKLEDTASILLRYAGGPRGNLWACMAAAGETVGLRLRVYGETGHLAWDQSFPDQLHLRKQDAPEQILQRGSKLSPNAKAATRLVPSIPEGFIEAFGNLYRDYAERIRALQESRPASPASLLAPDGDAGVEGLLFVEAVLRSASEGGGWTALERR